MKTEKLKSNRLQAAGWTVGSTDDFLQLSNGEAQLVAPKLALISAVKKSRIAKIEAGDASASLDLIVRALIASGATTRDIQAALRANERVVS